MKNCRNAQMHRSVEITHHAMRRLRERVGSCSGYREWKDLAKAARYKGRTENEMTAYEYDWYIKNIRIIHATTQVRIYNGFAYIFAGNHGEARTLVTVIKVAPKVCSLENETELQKGIICEDETFIRGIELLTEDDPFAS